MGDGIMALFGAPIVHEDHAVRACYAALAMQASVKQYAAEVQRTRGVPIHIRVGLNSGKVVVRSIGSDLHMDYMAVGQTTHLATRMEQMAMPGSILITAEVLQLAEHHVQVTALGPVPIKGVSTPLEVYEVTGVGPVRTRLQASAARGLTRFVGHDRELDQLRQALEQAGACPNRWPTASSTSRWGTWPTPSSRSRCSAVTTSPNTLCTALAAPPGSMPAWWRTPWA